MGKDGISTPTPPTVKIHEYTMALINIMHDIFDATKGKKVIDQ